jgi:hypothetical protein
LAPGDAVCNAESTSCDKAPVHEWDELDAFIQSVRAPQRPSTLDSAEVERGAGLFREGNCAGCHGGAGWTLSRAFYTPGAVNNGALPFTKPAAVSDAQLGLLRTVHYDVAPDLRSLNPPGALGTATLRRWDPGTHSTLVHLYGTEADDGYDSRKTHGNDQINCVLRAVGTYPSQVNGENHQGIVPADSPTVVNEVRDNMSTLALGATGFNMPSLVGVAAGAPYFHAGNARTLEELLDPAFVAHYRALAPGFLADTAEERRDQIRDLTAYLLSLDDDSSLESITARYDLCVPADGRID